MGKDEKLQGISSGSAIEPLQEILTADGDCVLAIITGVEGPSYRPVGAMLAVLPGARIVGTLSSGCVESDIALKADEALRGGPVSVRYGRGSPYFDIQLPCGGGMDVLLVPNPDPNLIRDALHRHDRREAFSIEFALDGRMVALHPITRTEATEDGFFAAIEPELYFYVFGKGPEASTFATLAHAAGYPVVLASPDPETLEIPQRMGCDTKMLTSRAFPAELSPDARSSVVLFFHDHDWEPQILMGALKTPAFYIGAQGSKAARFKRDIELRELGASEEQINRTVGPIGVVPSVKDARTLAVSVLAEILGRAKQTPENIPPV